MMKAGYLVALPKCPPQSVFGWIVTLFLIVGPLLACSDGGLQRNEVPAPKGVETGGGQQEEGAKRASPNLEGYDVFLVLGQSNTHYGKGLDPEIDRYPPNVFQLGRGGERDLKILPAVEPLDHVSKQPGRIGFALTFVRAYLAHESVPHRKILLIPGGQGTTSFLGGAWKKGGALYEDAVFRANHVMAQYPGSRLKAILWHQGESDYFNFYFKRDLDQFISSIRKDIEAADETTPFVLGGLVPRWLAEGDREVKVSRLNRTIAEAVERHPYIGYADPDHPEILKYNYRNELIHFDATGQRVLGRRYFAAYLRAQKNDLEPRPPEKVDTLRAIAKNNRVSLAWFVPPSNHSPVTEFRVSYREAGEQQWRTVSVSADSGPLLRHDIVSLKNGVAHEFMVEALNEAGVGQPSDIVRVRPSEKYSGCVLHLAFVTPELVTECGVDPVIPGTLFHVWSGEAGFEWYIAENRNEIGKIRTNLSLRGDYTKTIWFRVDSDLPRRPAWHLISSSAQNGHALLITGDGRLAAGHGGELDSIETAPGVVEKGRWHHAAVSYRRVDSRLALYLDGELVSEGDVEPPVKSDLNIGASSNWGFLGRIYDVRVYSGVSLSASDVRRIYEETKPKGLD